MDGGLARRLRVIAALALAALVLFGCSQCSYDQNIADKRNKKFLESQGVTETAVEPTTPPAPKPEPKLEGTWAGQLRFDKFRILTKEKGAEELAEQSIADTMEKDYPIQITVKEGSGGKRSATLVFGSDLKIPGTAEGSADEFKLSFRKEGDKEFKVGASPTVAFTFVGFVEQGQGAGDAVQGQVVYEVLQLNGETAWEQSGKWSAQRK